MRDVPEDKLKNAATEILGLEEFCEETFAQHISHITIPERFVMVFHLLYGTEITKHWECTTKKEAWTPEARQAAAERRSATNKARIWTPEQRKKISDAAKARYAEKGDKQ